MISSTTVRIKIVATNNNTFIKDESSADFTIKTPLTVLISSPQVNEKFAGSSQSDIKWSIQGGIQPLVIKLEYSTTGIPRPYKLIADNITNTGSYIWTIPYENSENCVIKITVVDNTSDTVSNTSAEFTIDSMPPTVSITIPTENTIWNSGEHAIEFSVHDKIEISDVSISYTTDGYDWTLIATGITGNSYKWDIPTDINSETCMIKINATDSVGNIGGIVSEKFTIDTTPPSITLHEIVTACTGTKIAITAEITDNFGIEKATLYYEGVEDSGLKSVVMVSDGHVYTGYIPPQNNEGIVTYYIEGTDKATNSATTEKYSINIRDLENVGSISGVVRDGIKNVPLKGVVITFHQKDTLAGTDTTKQDGSYNIRYLEEDEYKLKAVKKGYNTFEEVVRIEPKKRYKIRYLHVFRK